MFEAGRGLAFATRGLNFGSGGFATELAFEFLASASSEDFVEPG